MIRRGEVLVVSLDDPNALERVRSERWHPVSASDIEKWQVGAWPPNRLAFYQTKEFEDEAYSINYHAEVADVRESTRREVFPDQPDHPDAAKPFHKLILGPLQQLPKRIKSRRGRGNLFIPTTWDLLTRATEINDLFCEGALKDKLWTELKRLEIPAEREFAVQAGGRNYILDFAVHCTSGGLDIETDGDSWHSDPVQIPRENQRDDNLQNEGWQVLRFSEFDISREMKETCGPEIERAINRLDGPEEGRFVPREINLDSPGTQQLSLFDD